MAKRLIAAVKPPKAPKAISEMTDDEIDAYANLLAKAWWPALEAIVAAEKSRTEGD